jgi:hypothetical protein
MKDLSHLAKDSMWPTSQAGGNMMSSNAAAMTAPGSLPADPLPPEKEQGDPAVTLPGLLPSGTDGKPKPRDYTPSPARWGPVTIPDVVRDSPPGGN